jgi:hypothetical protein
LKICSWESYSVTDGWDDWVAEQFEEVISDFPREMFDSLQKGETVLPHFRDVDGELPRRSAEKSCSF